MMVHCETIPSEDAEMLQTSRESVGDCPRNAETRPPAGRGGFCQCNALRNPCPSTTPPTRHLSEDREQVAYVDFGRLYAELIGGKLGRRSIRPFKRALTEFAMSALSKWRPGGVPMPAGQSVFQVIDFFCGCGGMSLGFAAVSQSRPFFRLVGGCDLDPDAAATYELNFGVPAVVADVRSLAYQDGALSDFLRRLDRYDPKQPLVVIGCAPCQGFSAHRKKRWAREDERNSLIGAFAEIAVRLRPDCVVMENVPEMLSARYWKFFEQARLLFQQAGYVVHQSIYNAASFGVPQERFRALVIAMKHEFLLPEPLLEDAARYVTVREAIGHLPPVAAGEQCPSDRLHRSANHRKSTLAIIRSIPKNGGSRPPGVGPKCLDRVKGFYDVYGRLHWDRPAITITHYARNPASGRFVHPEQDRGLTMREAALLQSFPLGFEFTGSFDSVFKQIGEAVPPRFACAVAASVLAELASPPPDPLETERRVNDVTEPVNNSYSSVIAGMKVARGDCREVHMR